MLYGRTQRMSQFHVLWGVNDTFAWRRILLRSKAKGSEISPHRFYLMVRCSTSRYAGSKQPFRKRVKFGSVRTPGRCHWALSPLIVRCGEFVGFLPPICASTAHKMNFVQSDNGATSSHGVDHSPMVGRSRRRLLSQQTRQHRSRMWEHPRIMTE
ncbi:hypothetical protein CALVIDRAFT_216873 [Calocera viscosa TUFC12733]|uniref:Uncharacterized protein n=1 Tax=Calocera viscosa (strain TUFC12733) TaxID=1330018 RepID=A0A167RH41_CALVF|nr:hypothetical protein CALVIDRAFT_216873 [Calocera viscosa TUFC12733]